MVPKTNVLVPIINFMNKKSFCQLLLKVYLLIGSFSLLLSCNTNSSSNAEYSTDTLLMSSKYLDINYPETDNLSIRYFKNSIEIVSLSNNDDNYEFITIPFLVPPYDMFTTFIMQDYQYLRKNKKTDIYLDEFCDTTYWHIDNNNCYSMSNRFENGCINILCGNNGQYSYYSSYLTNDSTITSKGVKMVFKEKVNSIAEQNKLSEEAREQYLKSYIDSLNISYSTIKNDFPAHFFKADNEEHTLTIIGDFKNDYLKGKIGERYYIDVMSFFTQQNPFLGLALYYIDNNSFYPYTIVLKNTNETNISQWTISELFNQRNYMYFWSRVRE